MKFQVNRIMMVFLYRILTFKQILHLLIGVGRFMMPLGIHHRKRLLERIFLLCLFIYNDIYCCLSVKIRFEYIFIYILTFINFFKVGIAANICWRWFDELWIWLIWMSSKLDWLAEILFFKKRMRFCLKVLITVLDIMDVKIIWNFLFIIQLRAGQCCIELGIRRKIPLNGFRTS